MAELPGDRVSAARSFVEKAIQEGRAAASTREALEAFLFLVEDLSFHVAEVLHYNDRNEGSICFVNRDVTVGMSWSGADPMDVWLRRRGGEMIDLRNLVPASEQPEFDVRCDEKAFPQVAGYFRRFALQRLQSEMAASRQ